MNGLQQFAYRHIGSFRREDGGLYSAYAAICSAIYRRRMASRHRHGGHGRLVSNGRCTWCGVAP